MKNKINKTLNLILLLSMLNGNILSMQESDIEPNAQEMEIDQDVQQELSLLGLPAEVIEYILYQIIKPYEDKIKDVDNIFEFYSQLNLKQLKKDLRGALLASTWLGGLASDLINRLLKKEYQKLVNPIKDQYQGLSKDELNSQLRDILNQYVINRSDLEEVAKVILVGADVNEKNNAGDTALMVATMDGHKDIVQLLIDNKANVNIKNKYGDTVLMWAAGNGHADIVQLLIDNSANVNEKNNNGRTALMLAVINGHKDIVQLLIDNKANVNEKNNIGYTALMWAAFTGHKDIVQLLIDKGANVNEKDNNGYTALMLATFTGHKDIVELLEAAKNKENQNN